jgi:hypothetical protein
LLALLLAVMVRFPLRFGIGEVIYGTLCVFCLAKIVQVLLLAGKSAYRLAALILLCALLSGWQVFDLHVLRTGAPPSIQSNGIAFYEVRFPQHPQYQCLFERYYGHRIIAITVETNRTTTPMDSFDCSMPMIYWGF